MGQRAAASRSPSARSTLEAWPHASVSRLDNDKPLWLFELVEPIGTDPKDSSVVTLDHEQLQRYARHSIQTVALGMGDAAPHPEHYQ